MRSRSSKRIRLGLVGVGNVGRRVLELLLTKRSVLLDGLGLDLVLVGVADSGGIAMAAGGLSMERILDLKARGQSVANDPEFGRPGIPAVDLVRMAPSDVLLEASPASPRDGQPGLGCIEAALSRGMHVVTANKVPLVLAFPRLLALARAHGGELRFDATVAGGLPAVNLGRRDLCGATVHRLEGVLNLTANYVLARMEAGLSLAKALSEARLAGHAEADPSLDIDGWDAAEKLVILAHSVLDYPATLEQVEREGIASVTRDQLRRAAGQGMRVKLLAVAERGEAGLRLVVRPVWLKADHPLARLGASEMGIRFHTDVCGVLTAAIVEETPMPTAFAMLRDLLDLYAPHASSLAGDVSAALGDGSSEEED